MIRSVTLAATLALSAALGAMAASPALAYSQEQLPAPHVVAHSTNTAMFVGMMASDVSAPPIRDAPPEGQAKKVQVKIAKGRPDDRVNVSDPNQNPFMAPLLKDDRKDEPKDQPKASPAPAQ